MPFTVQFELFLDYGAVNSAKGMNVNGLNFYSLNINYISLLPTANCRVCGNLFKPDQPMCWFTKQGSLYMPGGRPGYRLAKTSTLTRVRPVLYSFRTRLKECDFPMENSVAVPADGTATLLITRLRPRMLSVGPWSERLLWLPELCRHGKSSAWVCP